MSGFAWNKNFLKVLFSMQDIKIYQQKQNQKNMFCLQKPKDIEEAWDEL